MKCWIVLLGLILPIESASQLKVDSTILKYLLTDTSYYQVNTFRKPIIVYSEYTSSEKVIKMGDTLFVLPSQTGILYKITIPSDNIRIERLDNTHFSGLNGGQYVFFDNGLFSYGGYGYWQTNGQLRKYMFDRREWEISKLNFILPSSNQYTYFDWKNKQLWLGQQNYINEILSTDQFKTKNELYLLSNDKSNWLYKGKLHVTSTNLSNHEGTYCETPWGPLVYSDKGRFEIWDFADNSVYLLGKKSDSLWSYLCPFYPKLQSIIFHSGKVQVYDTDLKSFLLSIPIKKEDLVLTDETVYYKPLREYVIYIIVSLFLFSSITSFLYFYKKRTRKNSSNKSQPIIETTALSLNDIPFTPTELAIIKKLKSNYNSTKHISSDDINRLVGSEKKSVDLQKKMRSDVLISINNKFRIKTGFDFDLIEKRRKAEDKRLFEYYLNSKTNTQFLDN